MTLYHGSKRIVNKPEYGKGNVNNDYGLAFYCTEDSSLASEWAVGETYDGYVNSYEINMDGLSVINLLDSDIHVLSWLAILLENRIFDTAGTIAVQGKQYILDNYHVDYKDYDLIVGWRADDSYFSFARAFINNMIPLEKLQDAMMLGNLGMQFAIKSKRAFDALRFTGFEPVKSDTYYLSKKQRETNARMEYQNLLASSVIGEGTYLIDLIRKGK